MEWPQPLGWCISHPNPITYLPQVVQLCQVIDSFKALTKEEKQSFFRLKDTFDYLSDPDAFPVDVNTIDVAIFKEIISMSREVAARVWGIFNTNQWQGYLALGVCFSLVRIILTSRILLFRFQMSTMLVGQIVRWCGTQRKTASTLGWSPTSPTLARRILLRSRVYVEEGEEVTVNYLSVTDGLNLSVRQRALQRIYG